MTAGALEISCRSCGATLVVGSMERTTRCPYCDSPAVIDRPATHDRPDPVFVVSFAVERTTAVTRLRRWLSSKRWTPAALRRATAERIEGVYLPAYLYTAVADSGYRARIGEDYEVRQLSTRGRNSLEKVTRTEHRDLVGSHATGVDEILVTASCSIDNSDLESIEPFDLAALRRYTPALITGWTCEEPSLPRAHCLELAREEARRQVLERLKRLRTRRWGLPAWILAYRYRDRLYRAVLSGQDPATLVGEAPHSTLKILAAIAGGGILLALLPAVAGGLLAG